MTARLPSYDEYRLARLPWLKEVPAHWIEKRAKYFFREVDERSQTGEEELLSVSHMTGVTPRSQKNVTMFKAESYVGHKLCRSDDLVINTMWAWMGALGVAKQTGLVSPSYAVYRPINADAFIPEYLDYLLRTKQYVAEYCCRSTGIRSSRLRLYPEKFLDLPILCPLRNEQQCIVAFLREKDRQVRRFIRNKRRLIELLDEQIQVIVNRAVTRGIDPNAPLRRHKDAWVGEVPQHWVVSKIKRNALFNPSKSETGLDRTSTESAVFLPMEKVSVSGAIDCSEIRSVSELWDGYTYFRRDDVVVAKITPCFENGKGAYLGALSTDFGFGTTEFVVLRATRAILPRFLYFLTQTKSFRLRATEFMTGAAGQKRVPVDFIKNYPVALPPIEEQRAILQHIDQEMSKLDQAIARAKQEIELIREYRTRLIADVVIGKVDVRRLAPEIIEPSPEDLEPLDDDDNFIEEESRAQEDFELAEESIT